MRSGKNNKIQSYNNSKVFGQVPTSNYASNPNNPNQEQVTKVNYYTSVPSLLFATSDASNSKKKGRSGSVNNEGVYASSRKSNVSKKKAFDNQSNDSRKYDLMSNSEANRVNYYSPRVESKSRKSSGYRDGDSVHAYSARSKTFRSNDQRSIRSTNERSQAYIENTNDQSVHNVGQNERMDGSYYNMNTSQANMNTSRRNLNTSQSNINTSRHNLNTSQANMNTSYQNINTSQSNINRSYQNINTSQSNINRSYHNLNTSQANMNTSYQNMNTSQANMNTSYQNMNTSQANMNTSYQNMNTSQSNMSIHSNLNASQADNFDAPKSYARDNKSNAATSRATSRTRRTRVDPETIPFLFNDFSEGLVQTTPEIVDYLPKWQKEFLAALIPLENQQVKRWYQGLMIYLDKIGYIPIHDELLYKDELIYTAQEVVTKHRMNICSGVTYSMRVMITGPPESGKSTLLSAISRQVLIDLVATNNWKQTFIYAFDFSTFANAVRTLDRLYIEIVDSTFRALSVQRPLVQQYLEPLIKAFKDAAGGHPSLPKLFTSDEDFRFISSSLGDYLRRISQAYKNINNDYTDFIALMIQLPLRVSELFGFKRIILFVDHWDNTEIGDEAEIQEERADYLNECLKQLFNNTFFVAACKDSNRAYELSKPSDNHTTDLSNVCDYISTIDLVQYPRYTEREFLVYFKDDTNKLQVDPSLFGGCTGYLIFWEELNELVNDIEHFEAVMEEEENADLEAEESRILLQSRMQEILPKVIDVDPYLDINTVTIVTHRRQSENNTSGFSADSKTRSKRSLSRMSGAN